MAIIRSNGATKRITTNANTISKARLLVEAEKTGLSLRVLEAKAGICGGSGAISSGAAGALLSCGIPVVACTIVGLTVGDLISDNVTT
jgi:hypothetical protein